MIIFTALAIFCAVFLAPPAASARKPGAPGNIFAPDSILLKSGEEVRGLIIKNTAAEVVLQTAEEEKIYPKSEIVRIRDEADTGAIFTGVLPPGELPPWRVIANALRTNDAVRSVVQIPAARIEEGDFRNVPYRSFRINRSTELNIFGNPESPAGIEVGLFGGRKFDASVRRNLRSHFAGYLSNREEVAAYYSMDLDGGKARAGKLAMEIVPPRAPGAFGTWWLRIYNPEKLEKARVSPEQYSLVTIPAEQVRDRRGRHPEKALSGMLLEQVENLGNLDDFLGDAAGAVASFGGRTAQAVAGFGGSAASAVAGFGGDAAAAVLGLGTQATDFIAGFFRDKDGKIRLIPFLPSGREPAGGGATP